MVGDPLIRFGPLIIDGWDSILALDPYEARDFDESDLFISLLAHCNFFLAL